MSTRAQRRRKRDALRPRILILEGLSGAAECVLEAGGMPVEISAYAPDTVTHALELGKFHGLLLTGGGDVNPRRYGEKPESTVYGVNAKRDEIECNALAAAEAKGWPVLGICRGAQIMNVAAGGNLVQNIVNHRSASHAVFSEKGSLLRHASEHVVMPVASYHHQEVLRPAPGYVISGYAPDGVVEAIESKDRRCLGVQFHPEMDSRQYAFNIFRWLVLDAARRADLPTPSIPPYIPPLPMESKTPVTPVTQGNAIMSKETRTALAAATAYQHQSDIDDELATLLENAAWETANKSPSAWDIYREEREENDVAAAARARAETPKQLPAATSRAPELPRPTRPPKYRSSTVYASWLCPRCSMRFDKHQDREDHMRLAVCAPTAKQSKTRARKS